MFRAHASAAPADDTPFRIPGGGQMSASFYFQSPFPATDEVQLVAAHAQIDNAKIVHHWTLSATHTQDVTDGEVRAQEQVRPEGVGDETPLASGGPGASQLELPPDVGLRVPSGANLMFELELHYVNIAGQAEELDATAVEACFTRTKRPIEAAVHTLGRRTFTVAAHARTDVTSTCVPESQAAPVHLLAVTPHMHLTGVHSKMILNRSAGDSMTLLDRGYMFEEQRTYVLPEDRASESVVLSPGDTITSTCTYDNMAARTIESGDRVENEMCEMAVVAWPAGALHNALSAIVGALPGNSGIADVLCMEL